VSASGQPPCLWLPPLCASVEVSCCCGLHRSLVCCGPRHHSCMYVIVGTCEGALLPVGIPSRVWSSFPSHRVRWSTVSLRLVAPDHLPTLPQCRSVGLSVCCGNLGFFEIKGDGHVSILHFESLPRRNPAHVYLVQCQIVQLTPTLGSNHRSLMRWPQGLGPGRSRASLLRGRAGHARAR
jgi:hypothetical protein